MLMPNPQLTGNVIRSNKMIEYRYQTFLTRFFAGIIDGIIFIPLDLINYAFSSEKATIIAIWYILYSFSFLAYSILMHGFFGRTLGKWITGVIVIDASERKILSLRQAFFRDMIPTVFTIIGVILTLPAVMSQSSISNSELEFPHLFGSVMVVWFLAEIVTLLFNKRRRALHDFIAHSVVVRHYGSAATAIIKND